VLYFTSTLAFKINNAESYGGDRYIEFQGGDSFKCGDGSSLFQHSYSCDADNYTPLHGVGINIDITHKCSAAGSK